jgi:poly(ADP-ribose) glycohydrolase ARH3
MWRVIGRTRDGRMRFTDDTQMSLDLGESLVTRGEVDEDDIARRFAQSYRWTRGYGPAAARMLRLIRRGRNWREANRSVYPDGSLGNGGAMRAPVIALFFADRPEGRVEAARRSASVTHAHPLGIEGAVVLAEAAARALQGQTAMEILDGAQACARSEPYSSRFAVARSWIADPTEPGPDQVRARLGNRITAAESCVTSIYLATRYLDRSFKEMQDFAIRLGGDVDTIGAMAGAIWGAANGVENLPQDALLRLEGRERLMALAAALHRA